jgi:hypothetical protein
VSETLISKTTTILGSDCILRHVNLPEAMVNEGALELVTFMRREWVCASRISRVKFC